MPTTQPDGPGNKQLSAISHFVHSYKPIYAQHSTLSYDPSTQNHLIQPILPCGKLCGKMCGKGVESVGDNAGRPETVEKTLVFTAESNIFPQFFIEKRYKLIIFATDRTIVDK